VYVRNKERSALEVGMNSKVLRLDATVPEVELLSIIDTLNQDTAVHAYWFSFLFRLKSMKIVLFTASRLTKT
jgi:5,10-methylene-tetrahydrofolate dehydrogenase/methenyl tetrahydrofolate cyclohydrolase